MTFGQALVAGARECLRRVDVTIVYLRSAFDDPVHPGKMSMVRVCAILAAIVASRIALDTVHFAVTFHDAVGMAGVLSGLVTTLYGTVCLKLFLRSREAAGGDGDDDAPGAGDKGS